MVGGGAAVRARRGEARGCAVIGCQNDAKSKGYCAAHYQKYRMLQKRGQADQFGWSDTPPPQSVENPKLPLAQLIWHRHWEKSRTGLRGGKVNAITGIGFL